jgi:hypothetical protein
MSTAQAQSWSIADIFKLYIEGNLIKSRIQRKKRWTNAHITEFVKFLTDIKNGIMPFLVNEKYINNIKKYFLFDGNNRCNAILEFLIAPLSYMKGLIPLQFSEPIKRALLKTQLNVLVKNRYNLAKFCRENNLVEHYDKSTTKEQDEEAFEEMVETLGSMNFREICIPFSVFENLTDEQTRKIYESINTGGIKLKAQELLASSTADITFNAATLTCFRELINILNTDYYEEMNNNELLKIEVGESTDSINLFEVLVSYQFLLSKKYEFISKPCENDSMDIIFKLYDGVHNGFNRRISPEEMNRFLSMVDTGCDMIQRNLTSFFNKRIGYTSITKRDTIMTKNNCLLILRYILAALEDGVDMSTIEDAVKRVMLYHIIVVAMKDTNITDSGKNSLRYERAGTFIPAQLQKIKKTRKFEYVPTDADIRKVLAVMLTNDITKYNVKPAQRPKNLTIAKALALSAFYSTHVPTHILNKPFHNDHIVPFSSKWFEQGVDINRLGNLVLIHDKINTMRGKKPVTDAWVAANGLKFMEYPAEDVYNNVIKNDIVQKDAFNAMCEVREKIYFEAIMKLL